MTKNSPGLVGAAVGGAVDSAALDALQLVLVLEYLQARFYTRAVAASGLIPATDLTVFTTLLDHATAHVTKLQELITQQGATPTSEPAFDFTAKGNAKDSSGAVFAFLPTAPQYALFTMLSQAFEDLGARAYQGLVGQLASDKVLLTAALTILSVEARHASEVRRLRGKKGWITSNSRDDLPLFLQGIYNGEDNVMQGGVDVAAIAGNVGGAMSASEAFDEPLSTQEVAGIMPLFLA